MRRSERKHWSSSSAIRGLFALVCFAWGAHAAETEEALSDAPAAPSDAAPAPSDPTLLEEAPLGEPRPPEDDGAWVPASGEPAPPEVPEADPPLREGSGEPLTSPGAELVEETLPYIPPASGASSAFRLPEIHGFVSQGFIQTTKNNFLANSERGSFEFSEVGLNFTQQLTDRFRVGMQLFMRDLGPLGNYKPQFDWFYLDARLFDWLGIRAGRTKIPLGLYNETSDIDAARVPILLPQVIYPARNREYLLAQTGVEIYGQISLRDLGSLEYRAFAGTIFTDEDTASGVVIDDVPYVAGGRLMWETPLTGLQLGGTIQTLQLNGYSTLSPEELTTLQEAGILPPGASNRLPLRIPTTFWIASLEYTFQELLFAAEYARQYLETEVVFPDTSLRFEQKSESFYAMVNYRVSPWFAPGAYYALGFGDLTDRRSWAAKQHDLALTLRFDINQYWLFKLEGHFMRGMALLDPALNDGVERGELARDWGLFLAKTTAYF